MKDSKEEKRYKNLDIQTRLKWTHIYSLSRPIYQGIGTILMFHRVCRDSEKSVLNRNTEITPAYLEEIIGFFKRRNYDFVSLDQIRSILINGRRSPNKFVAFTFDDGYRDNLDNGYPVLKKYEIPFTIYISTSFSSGRGILWWYMLEDLIMKNDKVNFNLDGVDYAFDCRTPRKKNRAFQAIRPLFIKADLPTLIERCERVFSQDPLEYAATHKDMFLDWDTIRGLSEDPLVTFGAHTVGHLDLSVLDSKTAEREILDSKTQIEAELKKPVVHFSFPYSGKGDVARKEIELVSNTGFQTATVVGVSNVFPQHRDRLFALPRIPVYGWDEDVRYLDMYISGFIGMLSNRFRRVVSYAE